MNGYQQNTSRGLVSQQDAAYIENAQIPRSTFHNQWSRKTAFPQGKIIPFLVDEVLPGDHMSYDVTAYLRMQTPLFPMFDGLRVDTHFFFVPNRIVWDNWVKFMGEQQSPGDSIAFTVPYISTAVGGEATGSLYDHMGIPTIGQVDPGNYININALPFRAYNLIFQTWFKDENLTTAPTIVKNDGPDTRTWYNIMDRAKSQDYFTSALPWPQKFTAPSIPLAGMAPVLGIGAVTNAYAGPGGGVNLYETGTGLISGGYQYFKGPIDGGAATSQFYVRGTANTGNPSIYADLSASSGTSINQLRQAWMVQSLLERDARGGTRYTELIRSHFGVINPDFRLQRPEYIGGGQSPLNIQAIAQTAPTAGVPLGALGGTGTAAGSHRASYAATEHGHIIGVISVKSELSYQQGLHKMWKRNTRFDFYWPALAQLGEQAVLQGEIYAQGVPADLNVFGYQERWAEYRQRYSDVTGVMKSYAAGTLDAWHLAQRFLSAPALNNAFIIDAAPMQRILAGAATAEPIAFMADIYYKRQATRPLPTYGTPAVLGRF